jgi:GntR family transcriptional regulator
VTEPVKLKHERIADTLEKEIRTGQVPRGARLPGEVSLARRFGVSRNTVRTALAELNEAGLIATRTGKGSFVLYDGRPLDARLGWAHALAAQGVRSRVRVVRIAAVREEDLAGHLGLDSPDLIVLERVRELTGGTVISFERSYVPAVEGLRELPGQGLEGDSLTTALNRAGLYPDHGEQRLAGRRIDDREAALLQREPGAWFLNTQRTSWARDAVFVEHVDSLLDPDHFQLLHHFTSESTT